MLEENEQSVKPKQQTITIGTVHHSGGFRIVQKGCKYLKNYAFLLPCNMRKIDWDFFGLPYNLYCVGGDVKHCSI